MPCCGRLARCVGLFGVYLGPHPECSEDDQRYSPDGHGRREAEIQVAVGVVHGMVQQLVPDQQSEDGECGNQKEREEAGTRRQQQTGEKTKSLERKAEKRPRSSLRLCGMAESCASAHDSSSSDAPAACRNLARPLV